MIISVKRINHFNNKQIMFLRNYLILCKIFQELPPKPKSLKSSPLTLINEPFLTPTNHSAALHKSLGGSLLIGQLLAPKFSIGWGE